MKQAIELIARLRRQIFGEQISEIGQAELERDRHGLSPTPKENDTIIAGALRWMARAQDQSASKDGGVARAFDLNAGWQSSYPETTGYIVPTFIEQSLYRRDDDLMRRAKAMLDWLVSIQLDSGAFQGGTIGAQPVVGVGFNTGQILLGLAAGHSQFGGYERALRRASEWLIAIQDPDGKWTQGASPFAMPGAKTYYTHVAWGLYESARILKEDRFAAAANRNIDWAIKQQTANGWLERCCLSDFENPLTHTIAYGLRGLVEAYRYTRRDSYLRSAMQTADGLITAIREDGYLSGRLRRDWSSATEWVCLTGSAQTAICLLLIFRETGLDRYFRAAKAANEYVCRTVSLTADPDRYGGVKGSFPVDGEYLRYQYPNWAAKFLVDSLHLENLVTARH